MAGHAGEPAHGVQLQVVVACAPASRHGVATLQHHHTIHAAAAQRGRDSQAGGARSNHRHLYLARVHGLASFT